MGYTPYELVKAAEHLQEFVKWYCRDRSQPGLVYRCSSCEFAKPDGTCLAADVWERIAKTEVENGSDRKTGSD